MRYTFSGENISSGQRGKGANAINLLAIKGTQPSGWVIIEDHYAEGFRPCTAQDEGCTGAVGAAFNAVNSNSSGPSRNVILRLEFGQFACIRAG